MPLFKRSSPTNEVVSFIAFIVAVLFPITAGAAVTYSRSPEGVSITSPVTITVGADSFRDFGLSAGVDRYYVTLDDDYNPRSACYPITQFPVTVSFQLPPGDVVKGVQIVGFTGACETGDEPYYLEGDGEAKSVAFTMAGIAASPGTRKAAVVSATPTRLTSPQDQYVPSPVVSPAVTTSVAVNLVQGSGWTRDLSLGISGDDVKELQRWLNARGYIIATSGPGSPGNESSYFGKLTQVALVKFQIARGITPSTGYFGPKTRAAISTR